MFGIDLTKKHHERPNNSLTPYLGIKGLQFLDFRSFIDVLFFL